MKVYKGRGLGDLYYPLIRDITEHGVEITTRGQRCLELPEPVTLVYTEPGYCWMDIPQRRFNPFFALAEVPWILTGSGDAEWISYFNKQMLEYLDEGDSDFHGSYGRRMRRWPKTGKAFTTDVDQIEHVVRKLKADSFSRQAIISLWDPVRDNLSKSKDIPCNNWVGYRLREGILHQTVVIRSNDAVWGTPHNAIQFSHLQALVAGMLGVQMGTLSYVIQNIHYYLDLYNPTLGHIVNAAMSGQTLHAQKVEGFCPVTDADVQDCMSVINLILKDRVTVIDPVGYWKHTIPIMIHLFTLSKRGAVFQNPEATFDLACSLPAPLPKLICEFWKDSKNPIANAIANAIKCGQ